MNKEIVLNLAKEYLQNKNIKFVEPGEFGRLEKNNQEVIFLDPLVWNPNVALVEPGDIRVWVNLKTKKVTWIDQM